MATGGNKEATTQPAAQITATPLSKKSKGNYPVGYECEFVERPPETLSTECSICLHIPREPHLVSCCGQHFCKSCIECTQSENKPCPLCNQIDFTTTLDKGMQRHLNALKVYCTNKEQGCEWVGELRNLDHHLNANPKSGEELTGCEFVELSCIHGCGERVQRRSLTEHHNNCPIRPFSCEYCGHSSTYQDVVNSHMAVCGSHPVPCPNDCGISSLIRQNLKDHLYQHCPLQKINCEFQIAGCTAKVQRKDLAAHLSENLSQHLSQISSMTKMLATALEGDVKEKFSKLEGRQESLKQELDIISIQEEEQFTAAMREMGEVREDIDYLQHQQGDCQRIIRVYTSLKRNIASVRQAFITMVIIVLAITVACYFACQSNQELADVSVFLRTEDCRPLLQQMVEGLQAIEEIVSNLQQNVSDLQRAADSTQVNKLKQKVESLEQSVGRLQQTIRNPPQPAQGQALEQKVESLEQSVGRLQQTVCNPPQPAQGQALETLQEQLNKQAAALHELETTLYHPPLDPSLSLAIQFGYALNKANTNETSSLMVLPINAFGTPCFRSDCAGDIVVAAKLESEVDGSYVDAAVERMSRSVIDTNFGDDLSMYTVTYTPKTRGHAKLHIKINNTPIQSSPIAIYVHHHPSKLKDPVKTIGGFDNPWGVAVNSQGEVYVTEHHVGWITVYSSSGRKVASQQFELPTGIAIDGEDNVYVASEDKLEKFNSKGKLVKAVTVKGSGKSVTVHHSKLYICDRENNRVFVYDLSLKPVGSFSNEKLNGPSDIAFGSNGIMYIADSKNSRLLILDQDKQYVNEVNFVEGYLPLLKTAGQPQGVHVSGDHVYVSDTNLNRIFVFSLSGELVHSFGEKGKEEGQFEYPHGITVDRNGFLYVCDYLNGRVQVF